MGLSRRLVCLAVLSALCGPALSTDHTASAQEAQPPSASADQGGAGAAVTESAAAPLEPAFASWQTLGLMRVRDMTPFGMNRLDMLPAHAVAATPRTFAFEFNLTYQNTWALSENVEEYLEERNVERGALTQVDLQNILSMPGEAYLVDGEYGLVDLTLHYRMSSHWGLYATIPYYFFGGGTLDSTIESFHDTVGFSNAGRTFVPRNQFQAVVKLQGAQLLMNAPPQNDLGDPVLGARYSLFDRPREWNLIVETALKVPLKDQERLVSTGEADLGLQVSYQRFFERNALYLTLAGVYVGGFDPAIADDAIVPTVIAGWETRLSQRTNLILQAYWSESVVTETELEELSADKLQATLGVQWLFRDAVLRLGVTENLANFNNTPDVGVTLSFAKAFFGHD